MFKDLDEKARPNQNWAVLFNLTRQHSPIFGQEYWPPFRSFAQGDVTPAILHAFGDLWACNLAMPSSSAWRWAPDRLRSETWPSSPALAERNKGVRPALFRRCTEAPLINRIRRISNWGPVAAICFRAWLAWHCCQWRVNHSPKAYCLSNQLHWLSDHHRPSKASGSPARSRWQSHIQVT